MVLAKSISWATERGAALRDRLGTWGKYLLVGAIRSFTSGITLSRIIFDAPVGLSFLKKMVLTTSRKAVNFTVGIPA